MIKKIILLLIASFFGLITHEVVWGKVVCHNMLIANTVSIIAGATIPLLAIIFILTENIRIVTRMTELFFLSFLGFYIQQITYASAPYYVGFFNEYMGFTLFFPIFGLILHSLHLRNKTQIVFISVAVSILIHVSNFILYPIVGGHAEQMYGIILIFGLPIAIIFGIIYAIYFIKFYTNDNN